MVAALEGVDYVVTFRRSRCESAAAAAAARRALQGHRLHRRHAFPSARRCSPTAAAIAIVGDPKDHSTRDLLSRIKRFLNKILIVRLGSLGDLIHAMPAAAALRRAFPQARIDWLVDVRHRELLDLVPVIDRRIAIETSCSRLADRGDQRAAAKPIRRRARSAGTAEVGGAGAAVRRRARHRVSSRRCFASGRPRCSTRRRPASAPTHVIRKNLSMLTGARHRSMRRHRVSARESRSPEIAAAARARLGIGDARPFAIINPGAAWPNKRWPPVYFAEVAAALWPSGTACARSCCGDPAKRRSRDCGRASHGSAAVSPQTTLAELVSLAKAAALMVSGDTGPIHVAGAVGTPLVGIYGPTNPERNGPWASQDLTVSRFEQLPVPLPAPMSREALVPARYLAA